MRSAPRIIALAVLICGVAAAVAVLLVRPLGDESKPFCLSENTGVRVPCSYSGAGPRQTEIRSDQSYWLAGGVAVGALLFAALFWLLPAGQPRPEGAGPERHPNRGVTIPTWVALLLGGVVLSAVAVGATLLLVGSERDGSDGGPEQVRNPSEPGVPAVRFPTSIRQDFIAGCVSPGRATVDQCSCAADELAQSVPVSRLTQLGFQGAFQGGSVPPAIKNEFADAVAACI